MAKGDFPLRTSGRTLGAELKEGGSLPSTLLPRPPKEEGVTLPCPILLLGEEKGVRPEPGPGTKGEGWSLGGTALGGRALRGNESADLDGEGGTFEPGEGWRWLAGAGEEEPKAGERPTSRVDGNLGAAPLGGAEGNRGAVPLGDAEGTLAAVLIGDAEGNRGAAPLGDTEGNLGAGLLGDEAGNREAARLLGGVEGKRGETGVREPVGGDTGLSLLDTCNHTVTIACNMHTNMQHVYAACQHAMCYLQIF